MPSSGSEVVAAWVRDGAFDGSGHGPEQIWSVAASSCNGLRLLHSVCRSLRKLRIKLAVDGLCPPNAGFAASSAGCASNSSRAPHVPRSKLAASYARCASALGVRASAMAKALPTAITMPRMANGKYGPM